MEIQQCFMNKPSTRTDLINQLCQQQINTPSSTVWVIQTIETIQQEFDCKTIGSAINLQIQFFLHLETECCHK